MRIRIVFEQAQTPTFTVNNGCLGRVTGASLTWAVDLPDARLAPGAPATRVNVRTKSFGFTFFARDVRSDWPIWIPPYGVAVVPGADKRDYRQVADDIRSRKLKSELDRIAAEPEETYENAAAATRDDACETWLGVSRDMRLFRVGFHPREGYLGFIQARYPSMPRPQGGYPNGVELGLMAGRGAGCSVNIRRYLEDGVLPILNAEQWDGALLYHMTAFVTLEKSPLTARTLRGTQFLLADEYSYGRMHLEKEKAFVEAHREEETQGRKEETVLMVCMEVVNTGTSPHYAFLTSVHPERRSPLRNHKHDGQRGFGITEKGQVFSVNRLNGRPMPQQEVAILLAPGEKAVVESVVPHQFLSRDRAEALAGFDLPERLAECRAFWQTKLAGAASIRVPEQRVDEMIRAGLLHLDLITYGLEPDGTCGATIGVYSPIGSESAPIIQFYDSVGWHKLAERSLRFFLDKQREDGFIQNFGGYMLETGAALWSMGEHYRYTLDKKWLRRVEPKLVKACEFLLAWRERNKTPAGMGLIEGKVADPEDHFRQFMLNGYAYLGMQRVGEMLAEIRPAAAKRWSNEAAAWRKDIRKVVEKAMAESPVIPLGDGSWMPTCPPWAEGCGPSALHVDGSPCNSHGSPACRDSLIGPLYLVLQEVIAPGEWMGECLMKTHHELFTFRNAAFSQPYYVRHDYAHLRRGEVAAFLKMYYNQFAALADRETYTFWEHYWGASPHKTHEEGWFLMQTRWMLWMEEKNELRLLAGIPRAWLEHGKEIALEKVASYFGKLSLTVKSFVADGRIEAEVRLHESARKPVRTSIRLPHPLGVKAKACRGGTYDSANDTVLTDGAGRVVLEF
jgi:hypothetical protein